MTTPQERHELLSQEIRTALRNAAAKFPNLPIERRPVAPICVLDWEIDSWDTRVSSRKLDLAMTLFVEGKVGKELVRRYYKRFVDAHKRWVFVGMPIDKPQEAK